MNKLLILRLKAKLTIRELAAKSGVSPTTITRLETGQLKSHAITIAKLADVLGVEVGELVEFIVDPKDLPVTVEASTGRQNTTRGVDALLVVP